MSDEPATKHKRKRLTADEYSSLVDQDKVLQFIERVNECAINDPLWNDNYALALHNAFGDASTAHLIGLGIESVEME